MGNKYNKPMGKTKFDDNFNQTDKSLNSTSIQKLNLLVNTILQS